LPQQSFKIVEQALEVIAKSKRITRIEKWTNEVGLSVHHSILDWSIFAKFPILKKNNELKTYGQK
jgi:hypothetical protein